MAVGRTFFEQGLGSKDSYHLNYSVSVPEKTSIDHTFLLLKIKLILFTSPFHRSEKFLKMKQILKEGTGW